MTQHRHRESYPSFLKGLHPVCSPADPGFQTIITLSVFWVMTSNNMCKQSQHLRAKRRHRNIYALILQVNWPEVVNYPAFFTSSFWFREAAQGAPFESFWAVLGGRAFSLISSLRKPSGRQLAPTALLELHWTSKKASEHLLWLNIGPWL